MQLCAWGVTLAHALGELVLLAAATSGVLGYQCATGPRGQYPPQWEQVWLSGRRCSAVYSSMYLL